MAKEFSRSHHALCDVLRVEVSFVTVTVSRFDWQLTAVCWRRGRISGGEGATSWFLLDSSHCTFHAWPVHPRQKNNCQPDVCVVLYWGCRRWSLRHKMLGCSRWSVEGGQSTGLKSDNGFISKCCCLCRILHSSNLRGFMIRMLL